MKEAQVITTLPKLLAFLLGALLGRAWRASSFFLFLVLHSKLSANPSTE